MCGIFGSVSNVNIINACIDGIKKLEYRGYDSCGLACLNVDGSIGRIRSVDGLADLATKVCGFNSGVAIAHSRWSTTGEPSISNAHPHVSRGVDNAHERVAVVHNGIIENYENIRNHLIGLGYVFESETDTEVVAHLIDSLYTGDLLAAVQDATKCLEGSYAIAVISYSEKHTLVAAKNKSPMVIGIGEDDTRYISSDSLALPTNKVIYIEDGEVLKIVPEHVDIYDKDGEHVSREITIIDKDDSDTDTGGYDSYMLKEIHEQPASIAATINGTSFAPESFGHIAESVFPKIEQILILACGTSYNAGCIAKTWFEEISNLPTSVEIASEYEPKFVNVKTLVVTISQSGETADTIQALKRAKNAGMMYTLAICNTPSSAIVRESAMHFFTKCGFEISVASTKAFTAQLISLYILANTIAGKNIEDTKMGRIPNAIEKTIEFSKNVVETWSGLMHDATSAMFFGRGQHRAIAAEGSLKLKEISYIHAESFAAGELKHGSISLITKNFPIVVTVARDAYVDKIKSNIGEVLSRGATVFVVADQSVDIEEKKNLHVLKVPYVGELSPIVHVIPLQLLAYYTAIKLGRNVDRPRNLSKAVSVE